MVEKNPAGAPVPGSWAQQQKNGLERQRQHATENETGSGAGGDERGRSQSQGEDRTPDRRIGQIAHADHQTGGAGEPQTTALEPEKQGGIGGP